MGDKSGLCLWCGRWTERKAADGLADCDRPDCLANRDYENDAERANSEAGSYPVG